MSAVVTVPDAPNWSFMMPKSSGPTAKSPLMSSIIHGRVKIVRS